MDRAGSPRTARRGRRGRITSRRWGAMSKEMIRFDVDPKRTAVIIVDMQNCFVENSPFAAPGGMDVLRRLNALVADYRSNGATIIFTRHVMRVDGSNMGLLGDVLPPVKDGVINDDRPSAA